MIDIEIDPWSYVKGLKNVAKVGFKLVSSIYSPFPFCQYQLTSTGPMSLDMIKAEIFSGANVAFLKVDDELKRELAGKPGNVSIEKYEKKTPLALVEAEIGDTGYTMAGSEVKQLQLATLTMVHPFELFQNTESASYSDMDGGSIIYDIIECSNPLAKLGDPGEAICYGTDNKIPHVYRPYCSDVEFIDMLCKNYIIEESRPLFFIDLAGKVNFTSFTKLITNKPKWSLETQGAFGADEQKFRNSKTSNTKVLPVSSYKLTLGHDHMYKKLKLEVLGAYADTGLSLTADKTTVTPPALGNILPVRNQIMKFVPRTESKILKNRPTRAAGFDGIAEAQGIEKLIQIEVTIDAINNIDNATDLIMAGETVYFLGPYSFSMYNGAYVISRVEYTKLESNIDCKLTLVRPYLDYSYQDGLAIESAKPTFIHEFAPMFNKSEFYSIG